MHRVWQEKLRRRIERPKKNKKGENQKKKLRRLKWNSYRKQQKPKK